MDTLGNKVYDVYLHDALEMINEREQALLERIEELEKEVQTLKSGESYEQIQQL